MTARRPPHPHLRLHNGPGQAANAPLFRDESGPRVHLSLLLLAPGVDRGKSAHSVDDFFLLYRSEIPIDDSCSSFQ